MWCCILKRVKLKLEQLNEFKAFHIFAKTVDLAHKLKLKALDLMHIAYTTNLASKGLANTIVTLDKEIKEKEPFRSCF